MFTQEVRNGFEMIGRWPRANCKPNTLDAAVLSASILHVSKRTFLA
jgi:hypothetical protein